MTNHPEPDPSYRELAEFVDALHRSVSRLEARFDAHDRDHDNTLNGLRDLLELLVDDKPSPVEPIRLSFGVDPSSPPQGETP